MSETACHEELENPIPPSGTDRLDLCLKFNYDHLILHFREASKTHYDLVQHKKILPHKYFVPYPAPSNAGGSKASNKVWQTNAQHAQHTYIQPNIYQRTNIFSQNVKPLCQILNFLKNLV